MNYGFAMTEDINKTRLTLIRKIKNTENAAAWEDFVAVYKGMIMNWATYMGCNQTMADDVFQESIISLLRNLENFEYNPTKGKFRGYLKTLVSRRVKDAFRRKKLIYENEFVNDSNDQAHYIDSIEDMHAPDEAKLDLMWVTSVVSLALKNAKIKVDSNTYDSFKLYAVQELPVAEVCARLGIDKEGTVYQQKSRFVKLVSKELEDLLKDWGDISFCGSQLSLDEPSLLKCITEIIKDITTVNQTMIFQPVSNKLDAHISLACKTMVKNPIPDFKADVPCILNSALSPHKWVPLETDKCTIGRIQSATISMHVNGVSSLHAIVYKKELQWYIKDENSTNGTFLNGEKLSSELLLKNGDIIHIAENMLVIAGL